MNDELWVIKGNKPVHWTVPFTVTWEQPNLASMFPAMALHAAHSTGVKIFLRDIAKSYGGEKLWRIKRYQLEQIGKRVDVPGPPEMYFSWSRPVSNANDPKIRLEAREDLYDFLYSLHQKGVGKSVEECHFWWLQFVNHIGDTMINHEKPVDFFWFKLHNSPYRSNWKEYVLHRLPKLGYFLCTSFDDARKEAYLHNSGAYDLFLSPDILSMNKTKLNIIRHVEVEYKKAWWKDVQRVERIRLRKLGDRSYAQHVFDSIKRRLKATVRIYIQFLETIARPSATDVHCGDDGSVRLVPNATWQRILKQRLQTYFVPVVVPNKHTHFTSASQPEDLLGPHGNLPTVPAVRSKEENLRDSRRNDQGSTNGRA